MKRFLLFMSTIVMTFSACQMGNKTGKIEKWKQEIMQAEQEFNDMAKAQGLQAAFVHFAAEDAVLMRNNKLVIGKQAIAERLKNQASPSSKTSLTWKPDFVDVSKSGDLAYTYGPYTFTSIDSSGTKTENKGVFHTVWKRQADGNWRYVWD